MTRVFEPVASTACFLTLQETEEDVYKDCSHTSTRPSTLPVMRYWPSGENLAISGWILLPNLMVRSSCIETSDLKIELRSSNATEHHIITSNATPVLIVAYRHPSGLIRSGDKREFKFPVAERFQ